MDTRKIKSVISVILCAAVIFSCFGMSALAADVEVVEKPDRTTFYQGVDWTFNNSGTISIIGGGFNLSGTVLSYKSEVVAYSVGRWPNMYSKSGDGGWKVGTNTMKIYCDDFPSSVYATVNVNLIAAESITVSAPPSKTILIQDEDWVMSSIGDVEFTEFDLTGIKLTVKYTDGTTKTVSYPDNELIGWAVSPDTDSFEPGAATLYAKFAGLKAPFDVIFATKDAQLPGDINRDFRINSVDALQVLSHSVGQITLDSEHQVQADVTKDGEINSADALKILQYSVGTVTKL